MRTSLVAASSLLLVIGCGSSGTHDNTGGGGSGAGAGATGTTGEIEIDAGTGGAADCADNVRPIFVLTHTEPPSIHSFDPKTLTFDFVRQVECPDTTGWKASSMSISRDYHAWVEWGGTYTSPTDPAAKRLDRVDLATGKCEPDVAKLPAAASGAPLGMAFTSDTAGSASERLYFIDTSTRLWPLAGAAPIGQYYQFKPGEGTEFSGAELSGTGGGKLFIFVMNWTAAFNHPCTAQTPCYPTVHIGEIDKTTGASITNVEVLDIPAFGISAGGFAFAHWGGKLWAFESPDFGPTKVYEHDPALGTAKLVKSDGPEGVVGAGVSTCAPLEVPQ